MIQVVLFHVVSKLHFFISNLLFFRTFSDFDLAVLIVLSKVFVNAKYIHGFHNQASSFFANILFYKELIYKDRLFHGF